jgi:cytochrome c-type biogenesis protein CcmH
VLALVVVSLVRAGVDDGAPRSSEDRVRSIAATMKCPVCAGQSVAESDADAARAIRAEIIRRVDAGESDGAIRSAIAASYGERIQLTPGASGFEGLVWILPVVALVIGLAGISAAFARWRRVSIVPASDEDRALVDRALEQR